jgi:RNA-binding protein
MKGFQKKYLRGLAHNLHPSVLIGQKGLTDSLVKVFHEELDRHELVKVKFNDFKDKEAKQAIIASLVDQAGCALVGTIGHTAIFYRRQEDPEKRKIVVPEK